MSFNEQMMMSHIREKSRAGVKAAAQWLEMEAKAKLTVDREGTSEPGQYPTTQTGELRDSVRIVDVSTRREVKYKLILDAPYAHHLKRLQRRLLKDFAIDRRDKLIAMISKSMKRLALANKVGSHR